MHVLNLPPQCSHLFGPLASGRSAAAAGGQDFDAAEDDVAAAGVEAAEEEDVADEDAPEDAFVEEAFVEEDAVEEDAVEGGALDALALATEGFVQRASFFVSPQQSQCDSLMMPPLCLH